MINSSNSSNEKINDDNSEIVDNVVLCSNCFKDSGLRFDAFRIGIDNNDICPNCKSEIGHKLTKELVRSLCSIFFIRGTISRFKYGGTSLIKFNEQHYKNSHIDVSPSLTNDVKLLENAGEIGLFYYGPRAWMFGEIEPLKSLQNKNERSEIISRILQTYPKRELTKDHVFYRLRLNPKIPHDNSEYDSAPDEFLGRSRFDESNFPIMYGSPDIELCLHECRTSVEDEVYAAKLAPLNNLKVLDLTALIDDNIIEFESLDMAIHFLFLAGEHSYEICRDIAIAAKKHGFDGIIYPSYFSYIRTGQQPFNTVYGMSIRRIDHLKEYAQSQIVPNLALFGRPICENKVSVECINKVVINRIGYEISFGPAYHGGLG